MRLSQNIGVMMKNIENYTFVEKAWGGYDMTQGEDPERYVVIAKDRASAKQIIAEEQGIKSSDLKVRRSKQNDCFEKNGSFFTRYRVTVKIQTEEWRAEMQAAVDKTPEKLVHIFSGEYQLYWRANRRGYAERSADAGVYTAEEAWDATSHCCIGKEIKFVDVVEDEDRHKS